MYSDVDMFINWRAYILVPPLAALVNAEHHPLVEYSVNHLAVAEEYRLYQDELQQSDQTFTLLARCCLHEYMKPASKLAVLHTVKTNCLIC